MFYDYKLMNSSTLRGVWCHANRQKVVGDNVGIPKICSKIEKLVDHQRLSLRSSALLLNGTARLYKEEVDKLYQDCQTLLYPHFRDASLAEDNNTGSEEHSRNTNNRDKSESARYRRFKSKNNLEKSVTRNKDSTDYESRTMTSFTSDQSQVSDRTYATDKIDAEVQTNKSFIANIKSREKYKRKMTLDVNLPMGVIMVYDEFNSPAPSKIICANINKKVKYL